MEEPPSALGTHSSAANLDEIDHMCIENNTPPVAIAGHRIVDDNGENIRLQPGSTTQTQARA
jgi:hypothetical protein